LGFNIQRRLRERFDQGCPFFEEVWLVRFVALRIEFANKSTNVDVN